MLTEPLTIVAGKGGVGRTTLASALASISAREAPTVLVTFDTELEVHPIFGVPLGYAPVAAEQNLWLMRVDGLSAVLEYVRRKVPFSRLYESVLKSRMFRDFAAAAPGFEELTCLGKLYDLVTESRFQRVIFDAPASGHFRTLINTPAATLQAVLVGPLNHNARKIQDLMMDADRTRLLVATLAEEMAVQEARELLAFGRDQRMAVGPVLVNQRVADRFSADEVERLSDAELTSELQPAARCAIAEHQLARIQAASLEALENEPIHSIPRAHTRDPGELLQEISTALEKDLRR